MTDAIKAANRQVGGTHYLNKTVQPWDAMEAWMTPEEFRGFLRGNVVKYIARYRDKGERMSDLHKCRHYLDRLIEQEAKSAAAWQPLESSCSPAAGKPA